MSLDWMARQIAARPGSLNLQVPRYNPHPAGVMREGSATKAVFDLLKAHRGRYFTHGEVVTHTGCTGKSVDWGLRFLKTQGHIDCSSDDGRNSRYLRYAYRGQS